ncbi:MAG TPA: GFA family protein [Mariprofundaceae bacterium]|nr:GFA family protein [Mariprofundaceae bacterium]
MSGKLSGTCDCGAVRYEIEGPVKLVVNCHCHACRKRNGASFSTYCVVPQTSLTVMQGQERIGIYDSETIGRKHFCSQCGTPLYNLNNRYPDFYMVHYGTVSEHAGLAPRYNIYCESKLPWVDGVEKLRSFAQAMERR